MARKTDRDKNGNELPPPRVRKARASAGGKARWAHKVKPKARLSQLKSEGGKRGGATVAAIFKRQAYLFWRAWHGYEEHMRELETELPTLAAAIKALDHGLEVINRSQMLHDHAMGKEAARYWLEHQFFVRYVCNMSKSHDPSEPATFLAEVTLKAITDAADERQLSPLWELYFAKDNSEWEQQMRALSSKREAKDRRYKTGSR